jgi:hypothetical protein
MPQSKATEKKFLKMPSKDVYYICQMVDGSLDGLGFERNIEGFMGDMACSRLLHDYPKFTPLHEYIEEIVTDVIWEEHGVDESKLLDAHNIRWGKKLWVDHLLQAHGFQYSFVTWAAQVEDKSAEAYLEYLQSEDILPTLAECVAKEAFHILFANRKVLRNFGERAAYHVLETAPAFYSEKLTAKGYLKRASIPQWVRDAIFHRDKGICVQCKADLTRLINQQNALHYDHMIPLAKGGMNDVTNLQLLCESCNLKKSHHIVQHSVVYESWYEY